MSRWYRLDADGEPVHEPDFIAVVRWFETSDVERRVARTNLAAGGYVSTVFLSLDHGWGDGPPVLWETMAFEVPGHEDGDTQERYTSRADAEAGHARIVAELGGAA